MDENAVLQRIFRAFPRSRPPSSSLRTRVGLGDDAAVLDCRAASALALSADFFIEGVHFLTRLHPPESIGYKSLARAVSDLGAMGARPHSCLLSLALPRKLAGAWLEKFLAGLRRAAEAFGISLIGGDTTCYPSVIVQLTVIGVLPSGGGILRSGARPGDHIFVTDTLGAAELGLQALRHEKGRPLSHPDPRHPFLSAHLFPQPPVRLAAALAVAGIPSAMMDISDGLSTDLMRLCGASGVGARIEIAHLPVVQPRHNDAEGTRDAVSLALHGGDDYGLLFTVPPSRLSRMTRLKIRAPGEKITLIGEITRSRKIETVDAAGHRQRLVSRGWDPFRPKA